MAYSAARQPAIAAINITPLVDVMLVLLVIFMIAAPTLSQRIDLNLPQAAPPDTVRPAPTEPVRLRIDASGEVYWNEAAQPLSALQALMEVEVQRAPGNPPQLQIDASGDADYGVLAKVLAAAQNARMDRIGFVTAD